MKTRSRCALPVLLLVLSGGAEGQKPDIVLSSDHFTTVVDVTYDAGHIFVLDRAAKSIFAFDKTTHQLLRSIGRSGKGPGEFLFPARLGWLGDTLWVHDLSNSRFTLLVGENPVGTVGLMTSIQPLGARTASPVRAEWLLSDGGMLGTLLTTLDVMALGILDSIPYFRIARNLQVERTMFYRSSKNEVMTLRPSRAAQGAGYFPQPLAPGGLVEATATGTAIYHIDRASYRVEKRAPDGRVLWTRRFPHTPRAIETAEFERSYEKLSGTAERWQITPDAFRRILRDAYYTPDRIPPVSAVVTGKDGTLWVRREADGRPTFLWDVISPAGEVLGSMRLPRGLEALRGESTGIWGVEKSALDVPQVVLYMLNRL